MDAAEGRATRMPFRSSVSHERWAMAEKQLCEAKCTLATNDAQVFAVFDSVLGSERNDRLDVDGRRADLWEVE
jgi:hypothetical protein